MGRGDGNQDLSSAGEKQIHRLASRVQSGWDDKYAYLTAQRRKRERLLLSWYLKVFTSVIQWVQKSFLSIPYTDIRCAFSCLRL